MPRCLTFRHTHCDHVWLIETCLSERKERRRRISKETANTGVAFYLLGRWGVITAKFNQFRLIIHGQGHSELISKMPLLSLTDSPVWIIQTAFTQRTPSLIPDQSVRNIMQPGMSIRNGKIGLLVCMKYKGKQIHITHTMKIIKQNPNFKVLGDYSSQKEEFSALMGLTKVNMVPVQCVHYSSISLYSLSELHL